MSNWIFLRGLTRESRHWGEFPRTFRAAVPDASVVTLDLPGNGALCALRSPLSVDALAQHCRTELLRRGVAPPYSVLALSLGAMVAVAWAARHPGDFRRCVLINTSLRPFAPFYRRLRPANYAALLKVALTAGAAPAREKTILRLTSRALHAACEPGTSVLAEWIAYHREHPVSRTNALCQLLAAARYRAPAEKPDVPMLVLASALDRLVDPRCSRALARAWNAAYAEHPTAGHDLPLDDGAWVAGQVRDWLKSSG
ncbi:MAG TPA: alpha/beta hydrolase [Burkholderiaceae bacterium]|nr:alpha/beta hydrolase [Burkholderiaceae bacterium]